MAKNKKSRLQPLNDNELLQVTGGTTFVSKEEYQKIKSACDAYEKDPTGCQNNSQCMWEKERCLVSREYAVEETD